MVAYLVSKCSRAISDVLNPTTETFSVITLFHFLILAVVKKVFQ